MALRSSRPMTKSMQTFKEVEKNMLPLNSNVVRHYFYLINPLTVTNPKYFNKLPHYKDVKDQLLLVVLSIWTKASLPVLRKQRIEAKLKDLIDRYNGFKKKMKHGGNKVDEEWLHRLSDICTCKCSIPENPLISNKKLMYSCEVANWS